MSTKQKTLFSYGKSLDNCAHLTRCYAHFARKNWSKLWAYQPNSFRLFSNKRAKIIKKNNTTQIQSFQCFVVMEMQAFISVFSFIHLSASSSFSACAIVCVNRPKHENIEIFQFRNESNANIHASRPINCANSWKKGRRTECTQMHQ